MSGRKAPHFAHTQNSNCKAGLETTLHLAAKQRILERGEFWFPELSVRVAGCDAFGLTHAATQVIAPPGLRQLSSVAVEVQIGNVRPDLVVRSEDFGDVSIEIAVTHFVDDAKLSKVASAELSVIEVDLSHLRYVDFAELDAALFSPSENIKWLHEHRAHRCKLRLQSLLQQRLDLAVSDARKAFEDARAFGRRGAGRSVTRPLPADEPPWVRQLNAGARAVERAKIFRAKPEHEKATTLCRWLEVLALPKFLASKCERTGVFGVSESAIWQSAFFIGKIHGQVRQGVDQFSSDDAFAWLAERFVVLADQQEEAKLAFVGYLSSLRASGAVIMPAPGHYRIGVADIAAYAAKIVSSREGADIDSELRWAEEDEWPTMRQAKLIFDAMGLSDPRRLAWRRLLSLRPTIRGAPPSYFCDATARFVKIEQTQLVDFLARSGYLRVSLS